MRIQFDGVGWRYRRHAVYHHFSWTPPSGRTLLVGPNGAGKTTLMRLATGEFVPHAGEVRLLPEESTSARAPRRFAESVGMMPQHIRAVPTLTVDEQVTYAAWLRGHPTSRARRMAGQALDRAGIGHLARRGVRELSGGELRRVGLAECLVGETPLLLLDEPTAGLDPEQRWQFRETLMSLEVEQLILSTHQVDELTDFFDSVAVLNDGHIQWMGPVGEFLALSGPKPGMTPGEAAYCAVIKAQR